ncbi:MAG: hypothetical protein A2161_11110 [Candidatus Schekmanbacteria bacterium RBG_13_48_7]|uniref:DUF1573 domain-containing protein n=1 Tax=Candidatus Schekmanbacteria bacterium RBG_13_48_7 TaxID=1817878 RepID=A0A1F7RTC8_9BACT|nr:MAG: hypothetical protein A2161_11110 [Candidatus Schekmanbacteria bacterium RBG_13_48_7]
MNVKNLFLFIIIFIMTGLVSGCSDQGKKSSGVKSNNAVKESTNQSLSGDRQGNKLKNLSESHPEITFEELKFDFGKLNQNEKSTHEFKFKNTGQENLVIEGVKSTCGCTAAITSAKELAPGETGSISVTLDPGNLQGKISKAIIVNTNDPAQKTLRLQIDALVAVDIEVKPEQLFFGKKFYDETETKQIFLVNHMENKELQISKIESDPKTTNLTWKFNKIDSNKFQIDVTLMKGSAPGSFNPSLIIYTNSEKQPQIRVSVKAEILGDIVVNPERISFGVIVPGEAVIRKVEIFHRASSNFKITKVTTDISKIVTELKTLEPGKRYQLTVTIPKDMSPENRISGMINIETNVKSQPKITIPFYGIIKGQFQKKSDEEGSRPISGRRANTKNGN